MAHSYKDLLDGHNHTKDEECGPTCLSYNNPRNYYPMPPLPVGWEAFLWMKSGKEGEVLTDPNAHWRIVDRNIGAGTTIYDFLKKAEDSPTPMLWGYVNEDKGSHGIYVSFLTHLSPGKQDLEYIQECLRDLERKYHKPVKDYDIEETKSPILESYTPTGVATTGQQDEYKHYPGEADTDRAMIEDGEWEPANKGYENVKYDSPMGDVTDVRKDTLADGTRVSTVYLGRMAPNSTEPFETMVFKQADPNDLKSWKTLETHYAVSEREALNTHYALVDSYNRKALEEKPSASFLQENIDKGYIYNDDGTWSKPSIAPPPNIITGSNDSHEPFMFFNNKLYFGRSHHADILSRAIDEDDYDWDDFENETPVFGWLYKPRGGVSFSTDTDVGNDEYDSEKTDKILKLLRYKFGNPNISAADGHNFTINGWNSYPKWTENDITWEDYEKSMAAANSVDITKPHQLPLFEGQSKFNAIEMDPGDEARHSERERPFVYHAPSKTLFYTTRYCHHAHIMPKIYEYLTENGHSSDAYGGIMGPWISGDITDPEWNERNWIKFINSDSYGYPQSVINYLQEKFGPREVMYSGEDGWDHLPEEAIEKDASVQPEADDAYTNVPREQRLREWRWSFDPDLGDLKVWEVENGFPGHAEMTGNTGLYNHAQGRVYLLDNGVDVFYWKNRPLAANADERKEIQDEGWKAIHQWVADNRLKELVPQNASATA